MSKKSKPQEPQTKPMDWSKNPKNIAKREAQKPLTPAGKGAPSEPGAAPAAGGDDKG